MNLVCRLVQDFGLEDSTWPMLSFVRGELKTGPYTSGTRCASSRQSSCSFDEMPVKLQTGSRYRLRLINITDNQSDMHERLVGNDTRWQWRVIAKDGANLPAAQCKSSPAELLISVRETYDVE